MCLSISYREYGAESRRTSELARGQFVLKSRSSSSGRAATPPSPDTRSKSRSPSLDPLMNNQHDSYLSAAVPDANSSVTPQAPSTTPGTLSIQAPSNQQPPHGYNTLFATGGASSHPQPQNLYGPQYLQNAQWQNSYQPSIPSHQELYQYWQNTRRNFYCFFFQE